jgi:hypothetical protein
MYCFQFSLFFSLPAFAYQHPRAIAYFVQDNWKNAAVEA